jgi:predicted nucleic-acid-binding Zn-ribbon protein
MLNVERWMFNFGPMKNGTCPKCNSKEVYRGKSYPHQREMITLSGTVLVKAVPPDRYACVSCGYVEFYLASDEQCQQIREEWEKVGRGA